MDIENIQNMFSEIGLGTPEQRKEFNKELPVYFDDPCSTGIETVVCNNTISNLEHYA